MEYLDLITFNEFGQGVINFESLEAVTSKEFVEIIKDRMEDVSFECVNLIDNDGLIVLYYRMMSGKSFYKWTFSKTSGSYWHDRFSFNDLSIFGLEVVSK